MIPNTIRTQIKITIPTAVSSPYFAGGKATPAILRGGGGALPSGGADATRGFKIKRGARKRAPLDTECRHFDQ